MNLINIDFFVKYFKNTILSIILLSMFFVHTVASPSLEEMSVRAKYIGIVSIENAKNATVMSNRSGLNIKSEDNVSRYVLDTIKTIKGDIPAGEKLIMNMWQKDYFNKPIKPIKPLSIGKPVLVFLIDFKPQFASWTLEKQEGHFGAIGDFDTRPRNYYYSIKNININEIVNIDGKEYTITQIKNTVDVCNSTKFKELQKSTKLYDHDKLKLYKKQYKMCPTDSVIINLTFMEEEIKKRTLSWQLEQVDLTLYIFEILFMLPFIIMGYYGKWRWTGILYIVYISLIIFIMSNDMPLVALLFSLLPFVSYSIGMVLYRVKKGTWRVDKVNKEIEKSFKEVKNKNGSYIIWEHERAIFTKMTVIIMTTLFFAGMLLFIYNNTMTYPSLILIPLVILMFILIPILIMFNRLRYQYECNSKGYTYGINDSRMNFLSFLSVVIGAADNNKTLSGSGLISLGIGNINREWSSAIWCKYDDNKKIIYINHGCCKTDKLYAFDKSYESLKAIVMKSIGEKCTGSNEQIYEGDKNDK
jgi:hypothetical protein